MAFLRRHLNRERAFKKAILRLPADVSGTHSASKRTHSIRHGFVVGCWEYEDYKHELARSCKA